MAYLRRDRKTGIWRIGFRFDGQEFHRSCRTGRKSIALRIQATVEETIDLVETGRLTIPESADVAQWILSGGRSNGRPKAKELRLGTICDAYFADQKQKAACTQAQETTHISHLTRHLKKSTRLTSIDLAALKRYAAKREEEGFRGRPLNSNTIRKELKTFRQIWIWAQKNGHVAKTCPLLGPDGRWELQLPKPTERPKFQTWDQITQRINRGGLSTDEIRQLWQVVFLDEGQVAELLAFVKESGAYPFLYPMFCLTAYTGARRSEVMRSHIDDIDFESNQIMIRERKRRKHLAASTRFGPCKVFCVTPSGHVIC